MLFFNTIGTQTENSQSNQRFAQQEKKTHTFLEYMQKKRALSRTDVYMDYLKDFCGKEIYVIMDKDVLNYLIFKDVNNSGRTIVHNRACTFLAGDSL